MANTNIVHIGHFFQALINRVVHKSGPPKILPEVCLH